MTYPAPETASYLDAANVAKPFGPHSICRVAFGSLPVAASESAKRTPVAASESVQPPCGCERERAQARGSSRSISRKAGNAYRSRASANWESHTRPSANRQSNTPKPASANPLLPFACALLLALVFALTGCAPEDLPESSPQGGTSTDEPALPNQINPSQLPDSSFIYDATISSLEKADSYMNGQTVQVVGEAVGDRVFSESTPDYCWITLEAVDGTYAEVAVYMTERASEAIDTYGAYSRTGTTLQVRGTFNLACDDHEGVSDLHATNVTVVAKGHGNATPFNMGQVVPGLVLVLVGVGLLIGYRRLREHEL